MVWDVTKWAHEKPTYAASCREEHVDVLCIPGMARVPQHPSLLIVPQEAPYLHNELASLQCCKADHLASLTKHPAYSDAGLRAEHTTS